MDDQTSVQLYSTYINLGSCYFSLQIYPQTKECLDLGIECIQDKDIKHFNVQLTKTFENLGKVCEKLGLFEESVNAYEQMLKYEVNLQIENQFDDLISTNNMDNSLIIFRDTQMSEISANFTHKSNSDI
eukprot:403372520